ncbi:MAG: hypothetical protein JJ850_14835 [Kordiimonadaceae bacterium]|nr:hypothetical protein [Kordiimonadaceae bacterium]MBO6570008.1 hypothetical protein [Kordiimonadaceae bacterium]MBO6965895.1 hypothetical protein [Kordiimonadaceae bacterium]
MSERLAFSMAMDLLFNGQNVDYSERPLSLDVIDTMAMFSDLPERAHVGVVGPGGGRLVKTLASRGYIVDAYEGRQECHEHLETMFAKNSAVRLYPVKHLNDPIMRGKMRFHALFCMDDLRAFRENQEWTENVQRMIRPGGYFVYSQISNKLPSKQNTLSKYFNLSGNYDVSERTAQQIRTSYLALDDWDPDIRQKKMAMETLGIVEAGSGLRRNIMSGVEVRYVVWRRKQTAKQVEDESIPIKVRVPA